MMSNLGVQDNKDWVIVGRFGRPHGIKGYIAVHSFTDPRQNILSYPDWFVRMKGLWQPLKILNAEEHARSVVVLLEGFLVREKVAELTNLDIAVPAAQLPALEPGEYYWHQLIGMTVVNAKGEELGTVSEIIATGSNDVLVVVGKERHLIPYRHGAVVLDVCKEKQKITVDWDGDYL